MSSLVSLTLLALLSRAASAWAAVPSLVEWEDPFWEGGAARIGLTGRSNDERSTWTTQTQISYGWETGIAVGALIPVVVIDDAGQPVAAQAPRLGGGSGHAEVFADFRLWGDAAQYLGLGLGAGFPWQTDSSLGNSVNDSWLALFSAFGRVDLGSVAIRATVADNPTFPESNLNNAGAEVYRSESNRVTFSVTADLLADTNHSPYVGLSYAPPAGSETGTINSSTSLLSKSATSPQTRTAEFGINLAPLRQRVVLTLEADYLWYNNSPNLAPWQGTGRIRWVF